MGGLIAVTWRLLADRRTRTVLVGEALRGVGAVPFLGCRVDAAISGQLTGVYRAVAEDLVSRMTMGELMELGSNGGYLALEVGTRARDLQITTMDPSPYTVQLSESRIHGAGLGRQVKVALGEAEDIPFPDESFDAVVSLGALRQWREPVAALGEIHRVLRAGGRAWLYDLRREMPDDGWELVRREIPALEQPIFDVGVMAARNRAYAEGEIAALVARSPFAGAEIGVLTAEIAGMPAPAVTRVSLQK